MTIEEVAKHIDGLYKKIELKNGIIYIHLKKHYFTNDKKEYYKMAFLLEDLKDKDFIIQELDYLKKEM